MAGNQKPPPIPARSCFVIGPIGTAGTPERKHSDLLLNLVIKNVLELPEFGFIVKRADEDADPGMIGDRIISALLQSDLVVADLTDLNPNAFYELGIRHGSMKPTIHLVKDQTRLPFDNAQHRAIFVDLTDWHSISNAQEQLTRTVRHVLEPGYIVSNPVTHANATFEMRQSSDPKERVIADLQERVSHLETGSRRAPMSNHEVMQFREELMISIEQNKITNLGDLIRSIDSDVAKRWRFSQRDDVFIIRSDDARFTLPAYSEPQKQS